MVTKIITVDAANLKGEGGGQFTKTFPAQQMRHKTSCKENHGERIPQGLYAILVLWCTFEKILVQAIVHQIKSCTT